jgi:glycosyltransferase involved in cell wall biosynthesis
VFTGLIARLRGARILLVMHELMPELFASKFGQGRHRLLRTAVVAVERLSTRFADHVVIVSDPTRDVLVRRGVPRDKVTVVLNAADERLFSARSRTRSKRDAIALATHGTILERSGFQSIVRAVVLVRRVVPGVRLVVVGTGEFLPQLRELAEQEGVEDLVEFRGYVPLDEIASVLARADIGVAAVEPDEFTDLILPTKLMEYVALGLPAVAPRTTAVEAYFDESMVSFFRPGDPADLARAIADLARDPLRAEAQAKNASARFLSRYAWAQTKNEYLALVDQLASAAES